jgi:hypothetical protein
MILTAAHPKANLAMIVDEQGNDLAKKYLISEYDTETQIAKVVEYEIVNGFRRIKANGKEVIYSNIHLPGTTLKFRGMKTKDEILNELIFNSWWSGWLFFDWMQNIAAKHFARKADKIYKAQFK